MCSRTHAHRKLFGRRYPKSNQLFNVIDVNPIVVT